MRRVIVESPFASDTKEEIEKNILYARQCVRDALIRGEAPIASHLLYTQEGILRDEIPSEREQGIAAGLMWMTVCEASVVYIDLGISPGMEKGIALAKRMSIPVEYRRLNDQKEEVE